MPKNLIAATVVVNVTGPYTTQIVALDEDGRAVSFTVPDNLLDNLIYDLGDAQFLIENYDEITTED